jgi:hypothetical protein
MFPQSHSTYSSAMLSTLLRYTTTTIPAHCCRVPDTGWGRQGAGPSCGERGELGRGGKLLSTVRSASRTMLSRHQYLAKIRKDATRTYVFTTSHHSRYTIWIEHNKYKSTRKRKLTFVLSTDCLWAENSQKKDAIQRKRDPFGSRLLLQSETGPALNTAHFVTFLLHRRLLSRGYTALASSQIYNIHSSVAVHTY